MRRNMLNSAGLCSKHVVIEQCAPGFACGRRQRSKVEYRVDEAVECRFGCSRGASRSPPPVVDQQVKRLERLNMMPPQWRNEDRIAGSEFGGHRSRQRLFKP